MDANKIIAKAEKLQALAASSNVHEAALAAAKLQDLLFKYGLSEFDVTSKTARKYGLQQFDISAGGVGSNITWKRHLLSTISIANLCKSVAITGTKTVTVFGERLNIQITRHMYKYLASEILRLEELGWNEKYQHMSRSTYATGFYVGAVDVIYKRLKAQTATNKAENASALVYIDQTMQELDDVIAGQMKTKKGRKTSKVNIKAYKDGKTAAEGINLDKQIANAGSAAVSAGNLALN